MRKYSGYSGYLRASGLTCCASACLEIYFRVDGLVCMLSSFSYQVCRGDAIECVTIAGVFSLVELCSAVKLSSPLSHGRRCFQQHYLDLFCLSGTSLLMGIATGDAIISSIRCFLCANLIHVLCGIYRFGRPSYFTA